MKLVSAKLCLEHDCEEVYETASCPSCASSESVPMIWYIPPLVTQRAFAGRIEKEKEEEK